MQNAALPSLSANSARAAAVALVAAVLGAPLCAQNVHYPDAQHANPPQFGFPLYTPGAGQNGNSVRVQFHCPDSFLQTQGVQAGYVVSIGLSIAGSAPYDEFVLRCGTTSVATLGADWAVNLPDQRVQNDLSGETIVGGGTQQNPVGEWVDFALDHPFHYEPGDHVVVDLTTRLSQASVLCGTTIGGGVVQRAYDFDYTPGNLAQSFNYSGLSFRMTFAPVGLVEFGAGCSSAGGQVPDLGMTGAAQLGTTPIVTADQVAANGLGVFVFGTSKREHAGTALPQDLGGGCEMLVAPEFLFALQLPASGPVGWPVTIPGTPNLIGATIYTQFAQYDPASPATVPFVVSEGGILSIF